MKALLILSEMRSGSTWLSSLTNSTNKLGFAKEWLRPNVVESTQMTHESHYRTIIKRGSTDNNVFAAKIFPYHLYAVRENFGYDFIEQCLSEREVFVVLLDRIDRLGAAISAVRAFGTGQWALSVEGEHDGAGTITDVAYDREKILENVAYIGESMAFWRKYLAVKCIPFMPVFYENIMADSREYVMRVANEMDVSIDLDRVSTDLRLQRDKISLEWRERFQKETKSITPRNVYSFGHKFPRTFRNLKKFLFKEEMYQTKSIEVILNTFVDR